MFRRIGVWLWRRRTRNRSHPGGLHADDGTASYGEGEGHLVRFRRTKDLKTIGVKEITRYIRHRQAGGAAASTILKELATLSGIFRFCVTEEALISNPVLAAVKPKFKAVRPNYRPTESELARVLHLSIPAPGASSWRFVPPAAACLNYSTAM